MKIKKSVFYFNVIVLALVFFSVIFPFILPEKFFYDAKLIVTDPHNEVGFWGSYPLTMAFYQYTGLKYLPFSIVGLIQLPILFYLLKKIGIPNDFHIVNVKNILVYLSFFMLAIFIAMPSKEFITYIFIYFIVTILLNSNNHFNKKVLLASIAFVIFGILYRPYYVFIPIIAIGMHLFLKVNFKNKVFKVLSFGLFIISCLSICYGIFNGKYFSHLSREELNEVRLADANSMITSPVSTDVWYGEIVGIVYGFFTVNFPINGLVHFLKPQIVLFVIWQLLLMYILLVRLSGLIKNKYKVEFKSEYWLIILLFSYFIIQSVFEPDLGSAVRHKIGIFPLIYYLLYYENFRKEIRTIS